ATILQLTSAGIPVMGHVGLTPQSVHQLGYKKQGKTVEAGERILQESIALQEAGAFAVVLEHIPAIGIGAGPYCDGQVLVTSDLLGLSEKQPPFAKAYANLRSTITQAVKDYSLEVREGKFPQ
ncbi:MAG: 3-methyl-2-oxobutanoate hydroxymethyltransferase, partial [Oscillatoriales cyanobacterium]